MIESREVLALRNVRMLAAKLKRRAQRGETVEAAAFDPFLRFCSEAGVEGFLLRGVPTPKPCPNCEQQGPVSLTHGHGWGEQQELTGYRVRCHEYEGGCGMQGPLAFANDDAGDDSLVVVQAWKLWDSLPRRGP